MWSSSIDVAVSQSILVALRRKKRPGQHPGQIKTTNSCRLAVAWVSALNRLTLRNDLALRTLLPLKAFVPRFKLISRNERFCPACYRDDELANRQKYNRLLWSIDCVEACPIHKVALEPILKKGALLPFGPPGFSRLDGSSLANCTTTAASEEQAQFARLVAELLDDIHQHPGAFSVGGSPSQFLQHAMTTLFGGRPQRLADHLGIADAEIHHWCSGKMHPSFPRLVRIAYCCGCAVSDVLLGNSVMLRRQQRPPGKNLLVPRQRSGSDHSSQKLYVELDTVFESGSARNLSHAALLLDVDVKYLRRLSPTTAAKLVERGRETRHRKKIQREETRFNNYLQSIQELQLEGVYPTHDKVERRMYQRSGTKLDYNETTRFARMARMALNQATDTAPCSGVQRGKK